jgi:lipoprotein-releasing system ATP-binding protein
MNKPVLQLSHIKKSFHQGEESLDILKDVSLDINKGEIAAIVGPSGCGKSTLLHIAGLLEQPDKGSVSICGTSCTKSKDKQKTFLRRNHLGFVYQYHHLLAEFSAAENIMLPQIISGIKRKEAKITALRLLEQFGIIDRYSHRPSELSGGEQQRVAIARALANQPDLLLADEPTGNLDPHTANSVFDVMMEQVRLRDLAVMIVSHNHDLAKKADKIFAFEDGKLVKK